MQIILTKPILGRVKGAPVQVSKNRAFYLMKEGYAEKDKVFMTSMTPKAKPETAASKKAKGRSKATKKTK